MDFIWVSHAYVDVDELSFARSIDRNARLSETFAGFGWTEKPDFEVECPLSVPAQKSSDGHS